MIIFDIYNDSKLKYPLTDYEYKLIPKVWEFLEIFKKRFVFITDYRNYVIEQINKKYKIDDFYLLESILNKMFWNLRHLLKPLWIYPKMEIDDYIKYLENDKSYLIPESLLLCKFINYNDKKDLNEKIRNVYLGEKRSYYRSFINKLMIIDKEKKQLIVKPMEGSSDIFSKNYFNLLTSQILFSKELYEEVMKNPFIIKNKKIELAEFYYQYDYAFPNLNYCKYNIGTKKDRIDRIKKMYYYNKNNANNGNKEKAKYWFKLIK